MKIQVNGVDLFEVQKHQRDVLTHFMPDEVLEPLMKRNLEWVLRHKYEECFKRLKKEWLPKLEAAGVTEIPADPDAFAEMVFALPEYKSRQDKDMEEVRKQNEKLLAENPEASPRKLQYQNIKVDSSKRNAAGEIEAEQVHYSVEVPVQ